MTLSGLCGDTVPRASHSSGKRGQQVMLLTWSAQAMSHPCAGLAPQAGCGPAAPCCLVCVWGGGCWTPAGEAGCLHHHPPPEQRCAWSCHTVSSGDHGNSTPCRGCLSVWGLL